METYRKTGNLILVNYFIFTKVFNLGQSRVRSERYAGCSYSNYKVRADLAVEIKVDFCAKQSY